MTKKKMKTLYEQSFSDDYSEKKSYRRSPYRTSKLSKRLNTEYRKYWIDNKKEPSHQRRILTGKLITLTLKHITQLKRRIRRRNLSIPLSTVYG